MQVCARCQLERLFREARLHAALVAPPTSLVCRQELDKHSA